MENTNNTNSKPVARMRTVDEAYALLKELDPETSVSKNFIRRLALMGKIPVLNIGRRRLINFDLMLEYLKGLLNFPVKTESARNFIPNAKKTFNNDKITHKLCVFAPC